jgi:uncharacterized membrane protein
VRAHLLKLWLYARASYWFWPSVMALGSIALSVVTIEIDAKIDPDWPRNIPFAYANQPAGARALLATVAGSMITVTGITFSLTLLAVSHATSQFGPRLLTNFMRDRGNQLTLGTFIATFLYCLLILRTVRSAEEPAANAGGPSPVLLEAFVPHVSVYAALLLTLASVGVLIYFIHHIPESIRLSNVVANVGQEMFRAIPELFPENIAHDPPEAEASVANKDLPDKFAECAARVTCNGDGYIQTIDENGLLSFAVKHDLMMQILAGPGDFVSEGQVLILVHPAEQMTEEREMNLRFMFARGSHRTSAQNVLFLVDQLVEVAARALSPGVNDPMTAMTCLDWLQSALLRVTRRGDPATHRFDEQGNLRIVAEGTNFKMFCARVFDQLRPYLATDRNAALHGMKIIARVIAVSDVDEHREILRRHARELVEAAESEEMFSSDLSELRKMCDACDKR